MTATTPARDNPKKAAMPHERKRRRGETLVCEKQCAKNDRLVLGAMKRNHERPLTMDKLAELCGLSKGQVWRTMERLQHVGMARKASEAQYRGTHGMSAATYELGAKEPVKRTVQPVFRDPLTVALFGEYRADDEREAA